MKKWKRGTIKIPSQDRRSQRMDYFSVRTDGNVFQIQESRVIPEPCGTIDDFNADYQKATKGLVDVTLSLETHCINEGEGSCSVFSELKATGWRSELTKAEQEAITESTFI